MQAATQHIGCQGTCFSSIASLFIISLVVPFSRGTTEDNVHHVQPASQISSTSSPHHSASKIVFAVHMANLHFPPRRKNRDRQVHTSVHQTVHPTKTLEPNSDSVIISKHSEFSSYQSDKITDILPTPLSQPMPSSGHLRSTPVLTSYHSSHISRKTQKITEGVVHINFKPHLSTSSKSPIHASSLSSLSPNSYTLISHIIEPVVLQTISSTPTISSAVIFITSHSSTEKPVLFNSHIPHEKVLTKSKTTLYPNPMDQIKPTQTLSISKETSTKSIVHSSEALSLISPSASTEEHFPVSKIDLWSPDRTDSSLMSTDRDDEFNNSTRSISHSDHTVMPSGDVIRNYTILSLTTDETPIVNVTDSSLNERMFSTNHEMKSESDPEHITEPFSDVTERIPTLSLNVSRNIVTDVLSEVLYTNSVLSSTTVAASQVVTEYQSQNIQSNILHLSPVSITVDPSSIQTQMMSSYNASGGVVIGGKKSEVSDKKEITIKEKHTPTSKPILTPTQPIKSITKKDRYPDVAKIKDKTGKSDEKTTDYKKVPAETTHKPEEPQKPALGLVSPVQVATIIPKTDASSTTKDLNIQMPLYLTVELKMDWPQFCLRREEFKSLVVKSLKTNTNTDLEPHQVIFIRTMPCKTNMKFRRKVGIDVHFYIADPKGDYNYDLTDKCADNMGKVFEGSTFEDKVIDYYTQPKRVKVKVEATTKQNGGTPKNGVIIAIAVSSVAGVVFLALLTLQIFIIKRKHFMKKRYVCETGRGSNDPHNSDSIHLTSINRMREALAYTNPGMQMESEKDPLTHLINFAGLDKFANDDEFLAEEFRAIPNFMPSLAEIPEGAEDRNRYANVIPVPRTRVQLSEMKCDPISTYINANYIKGYANEEKTYIATQAPLDNTVADFWRMVWEQQSQVIIMLTLLKEKGMPKCAEYWPNTDGGDRMRRHGNHEITLKEREIKQDFIISTLILKDLETKTDREVTHCWYTNWPAHRLPDPSLLLKFVLEVHPLMEENHGPTVVHCSPGTGRTGAYLAIDINLRQYNHKRTVNVVRTVNRLRSERGGCVQTRDQYNFIYKVLNMYSTMLCSTSSTSSSNSSLNEITETAGFMDS